MRKLLKPEEVGEMLGVKSSTVYKYAMSKRIPSIKIAGNLRFDPEKLAKFIDAHQIEPIKAEKRQRVS